MVRASLAELVGQKKRTRDALKRMRDLAEEGGMELGKKSWRRDDLHER